MARRTGQYVAAVVTIALISGCAQKTSSDEFAGSVGVAKQAAGSVVLTVSSGSTAYVGGGSPPPVVVDAALTVTGSATITGATMSFDTGFVSAQDRLNFATIGTITGSYNTSTGVLTLSGAGTLAEYETALRSVTYSNTSSTPTAGTRAVTISLGTAVANTSNGHFYEFVSASGTWTQARTAAATRSYLGLQGYLATLSASTENDFVRAKLTSDGWFGAQATPETSFPRNWYWVTGPETGTAICSNPSSGTCTSISGAFSNWAGGEPNNAGGEGCAQIYFANLGRWNDLPCNSTTLAGYLVEYGGMAGDPVLVITGTKSVVVSYTATQVTTTGTTLTYNAGDAATAVDPGVTVTGTSTITSATVSITSGFVSAQDVLAMATSGAISASYNSATGVLTLSGTGTTADYQTAFRTVTYRNTVSPLPTTAARNVRFTATSVSGNRALQVMAQPTLTLSSSNASAPYGSSVTLTATMNPTASTGTVQFFADGTSLGTPTLSSGVASVSTSSLSIGSHAITANYSGDSQRLTASGSFTQTVTTLAAGQGPCTAGNQATVCASGLCNTTTSTCGAPNGSACTAANQCALNVCGLNNICGVPNGGACTVATAAQCQTGTCSPNNNTCMPVGGCAVNADCSPGHQCNGSLLCEVAPSLTTSSGTTVYDALLSNVAVDSNLTVVGANSITGATVTIGTGFSAAQDRLVFTNANGITGSYNTSTGVLTLSGTASTATYQDALRSVLYANIGGATPSTALRTITFGMGAAVANSSNGHFYEFVSSSGTWTTAKNAAAARTYLGLHGYLATLTSAAENDFVRGKLTSDGWFGAQATPETSFPRTWYWVTGPETGTAICSNPSSGSCTSISGAFSNWAGGEPNNAGGEGCSQIYFANVGRWNDLPCNSTTLAGYLVEYGGSSNDPVLVLSADKLLQVRAATSIALGSSKASSALHESVTFTATFTPSSATGTAQFVIDGTPFGGPVTISGGVATLSTSALTLGAHTVSVTYAGDTRDQSATGTLAGGQTVNPLGNGVGPCTSSNAATDCASGVCSPSTSTCGYASGEGPCTPSTAAVCQSGSCSAGGACMPAGGCYVDADCGSSNYCNRSTFACTPKLGSGVSIPNDGLHDGTCSTGTSPVCASGTCNTSTNTCAVANGAGCSTAADCTTNACSPNNHTCMPVGGCAVTADCATGMQCNSSQACEVAPGITASPGTTDYNALQRDVVIDADLLVVGANPIDGATVTIGTGFSASQDQLLFTDGNGITGSYNASTGVLTLSGTASTATYQDALRSVLYRNTGGATPSTALRTMTFGLGNAVANSSNGHFYEFVSSTGTWTAAKNAAVVRSYLGLHGYLATLTSAAENAFVRGKLTSDGWFGAQATPEISFPRTWYWVTGPETGTAICSNPSPGSCTSISGAFSNWAGGEPNSYGAGEGCSQIYFANAGRWNDLPCNGTTLAGYLVEYGGMPSDPVLVLSADKLLQVRAATSAVVSSSNPGARLHEPITFTATLTPSTASGTVQFSIDGGDVGSPVTLVNGVASVTLPAGLTLGHHTVSVSYDGDTEDLAASGDLSGGQTVLPLLNASGPCDSGNAATDCASGVCSSAGTCGYGVNEGPCTPGSSALCQSGVCSVGGACMPSTPGGCYVDGDCSAGSYCDRASNSCQPSLATGVALPSDGLHDGTCPAGGLTPVCASGSCNVWANTCSAGTGASCTGPSQCTSNVCAPSGVCIPSAPGSCWADQDCGLGALYCDHALLTCVMKLPAGTPIPSDGLHDGVCTGGASATCASGVCNVTTNTCADGMGAGCSSGAQCTSNQCAPSGHCVPATSGSCWADSDCTGSTYCDRATLACVPTLSAGTALPNDGLHDGTCPASGASPACSTGSCNVVTNTCAADTGASCTGAAQCTSNVCTPSGYCVPATSASCWADADCGGAQYCDRAAYTCTAKLPAGTAIPSDGLHDGRCVVSTVAPTCEHGLCNVATNTCADATGSTCTANDQCQYGTCSHGRCGLADGESGCTQGSAYLCQSGACSPSGTCVPNVSGSCFIDSDCSGAEFCDRAHYRCAAKGIAGDALPNDGVLHQGVCTDELAQAACATAACNPATNTCAVANGAACTAASQCVTNVCGGNGLCGRANGESPCTVATGPVVCQSGHCNPQADGSASACVPSSTGCWVDRDCAATEYCSRDSFTCTARLGAGQPLPDDGLHSACPPSGISSQCSTGLCNPVTNTCAEDNNHGCTADNQCVTNTCGSNGECGLADGQPGCTVSNGGTLCQSGACTASGVCAPGGGCFVDSDCATGQYCDRSTLTCTGRLASGVSIPNDGLHNGQCDSSNAVVCASGECNPTTDTCAGDRGADCANPGQCVGNVCGSNGHCGYADGQAGCTPSNATGCQSGTCSSDGVCIPQGSASCWVDVDCMPTEHCKRDSLACVSDFGAGAALVADTLHSAVCSASNAQAECSSGECNPAKNTCALPTGSTCTIAAQCVIDVCGNNGKCGLANGQEGCSASTVSRCQSATCSVSGTCMPSNGCWVDADCATGTYCDRSTSSCKALVISGGSVPSDGLHDGLCTDANAATLCASGSCNATTNTCGSSNTQTCQAASECASNVCSADGRCGLVDGAQCTNDSQCRNGCVEGRCAASDHGKLTGGGGCSSGGSQGWSVATLLVLALLALTRSRRAAVRVATVVVVVAGVAPGVAHAQTSAATASGAAVNTFRSAPAGSDWFGVDSLDLRGQVRPAARLLIDWAHNPVVVDNGDGTKRATALQNQWFVNLGAAVTLFDRVRVSLNVPISPYQNGFAANLGGVEVQPHAAGGFGDLAFGVDVRLFGQYRDPFTLAAGVGLTAPSGSRVNLLGDGTASVMPKVLAAGQAGWFSYAGQLAVNFRGASIGSVDFSHELRFAASAGVKLLGDQLLIGPELYAIAPLGAASGARPFGLEGNIGGHFAVTPDWRVGLGVGTGLVRSVGVPDVRLLAAVDWSPAFVPPAPADADFDGVPDASDACPNVRGLRTERGCPAPLDTDHDGVPDSADLCPGEGFTASSADPKRPGCPLPPDQDGDGVADEQDGCPLRAAGPTPNAAKPGCPDGDEDHDGVLDSVDACPGAASGSLADPKRPGCPWADADHDGVPDERDACPSTAGAPSESEKSGCPGLVRLEDDHLRIVEPVKFAPGQDTLLPSSIKVLEAVASALKAMPHIERVSIDGHTDAQGKLADNQALSERRSKRVVQWLVDHGIDAGRLEPHGYGASKLLVIDEKTEADRATNRRVEFTVTKVRAP